MHSPSPRALLSSVALFSALALYLPAPANAGRLCEEAAPQAQQTVKATQMAERTLSALDAFDDRVVLLARVGQDLAKYGLTYSHVGFAVRRENGWDVMHALNTCGTADSALYAQGMVDFFSDSPFKYQAGIWRLQPAVQDRVLDALAGKTVLRLHQAHYNMLAYPFNSKYQNSNGWVLEVLTHATAPKGEVVTRDEAQEWLRRSGYVPTQLEIDAVTRLGARMFKANIAFDDHPPELRWNGKIQTVTVASVAAYLARLNVCREAACNEATVRLD